MTRICKPIQHVSPIAGKVSTYEPLTVDSTLITADSTIITADATGVLTNPEISNRICKPIQGVSPTAGSTGGGNIIIFPTAGPVSFPGAGQIIFP